MTTASLYIGLMSGTSADSLDAPLVNFSSNTPQLINTHSLSLDSTTRQTIHKLALNQPNEIELIRELDEKIALLSCQAITELCRKAQVTASHITAIGSHGQTVRHCPATNSKTGYSLQVGDPNIIAQATGITTIADFRRRDIAAGGHGAPLAPAFHHAVFQSNSTHRFVVNLGGIANITSLHTINAPIGYDTGPANGLMDSWCQKHLKESYDNNGQWAKSGKVNEALLDQLLQHPYFGLTAPKSTGRETFNLPWLEDELTAFDAFITPEDVQASLLHLTAKSLAQAIHTEDPTAQAEVYICGGGAYNSHLMEVISQYITPRSLADTSVLGVAPQWVEAMAFAWLAKQTLNHVCGNLPSVTGAHSEVILGGIYPA